MNVDLSYKTHRREIPFHYIIQVPFSEYKPIIPYFIAKHVREINLN